MSAVIACHGLRRDYRMGEHVVAALAGVDLEIRRGEYVAIIGPSGSGKSTLMYLLGCLDTPTGGSYRLVDRPADELDDGELSRLRNRRVGFVFQQYHLLGELTVVENIALGLTYGGAPMAERRAIAGRLAAALGLGDRLQHRATELSGGQQQRVAIARALATRPDLILADEPTGNLDSRTGRDILAVLRQLHADGATVVLVTHDPVVAEEAERVVTIVDGRIVEDRAGRGAGTPSEDGERNAALAAALPEPARLGELAGGRIAWWDLLRTALREGILAHKLRSFLTMLGIVFGIAAVISMTAITRGGREEQLAQIRQIGLNNIQIRDLGLEGARLLRARRQCPEGLSLADAAVLREHVPGIAYAAAWRGLRAELRHADRLLDEAEVVGVSGDFQEVVNYRVAHGRFVDARDAAEAARVVVLGPRLATELGLPGAAALGELVVVGDQPMSVVGVMAEAAFGEGRIGDIAIEDRTRQAFIPFPVLEHYFRRDAQRAELDAVGLRMQDEGELLAASELVEHIISERHDGAGDAQVSVPLEKLRQAQRTKEVFNVIITVIAAISLLVGGIGIMNIMLATVTERTREVGIRRAIGATRRDVLRQFLLESLILAGSGGLLGIAIGLLGALGVERAFGFAVAFDLGSIAVAVGVSVCIGVVFGLYPAWKAARMDPVTALRS